VLESLLSLFNLARNLALYSGSCFLVGCMSPWVAVQNLQVEQ
jgi:hypothetical protein